MPALHPVVAGGAAALGVTVVDNTDTAHTPRILGYPTHQRKFKVQQRSSMALSQELRQASTRDARDF